MTIPATALLSLGILTQVTQAACCGEAEPVHPAKALRDECEALQRLVNPGPPATYRAEFAPAIKAIREKVVAYSQTHTGADLDPLNWGNALKSVYMTSAFCEWKTVGESEANVRAIWKTLSQVTPQDTKRTTDLCLGFARWHVQGWSTREPEACAACLDEAALRFLPDATSGAVEGWRFVAPYLEGDHSWGRKAAACSAGGLSAETREQFHPFSPGRIRSFGHQE